VSSVYSSSIETEIPSGLETGPAFVEVSVGDRTAIGPDFTVEPEAQAQNQIVFDSDRDSPDDWNVYNEPG